MVLLRMVQPPSTKNGLSRKSSSWLFSLTFIKLRFYVLGRGLSVLVGNSRVSFPVSFICWWFWIVVSFFFSGKDPRHPEDLAVRRPPAQRAVLRRELGRGDVRRGAAVPEGVSVGASRVDEEGDAQHTLPDAPPRRQRRGIHLVPGQRHLQVRRVCAVSDATGGGTLG